MSWLSESRSRCSSVGEWFRRKSEKEAGKKPPSIHMPRVRERKLENLRAKKRFMACLEPFGNGSDIDSMVFEDEKRRVHKDSRIA